MYNKIDTKKICVFLSEVLMLEKSISRQVKLMVLVSQKHNSTYVSVVSIQLQKQYKNNNKKSH